MDVPFSAQDFIQLPNLDASEMIAITEELGDAGHAETDAPAAALEALSHLQKRKEELRRACESSAAERAGEPSPELAREADHHLDGVWSSVRDWLLGWCKLPREDNPHAAIAQALFARLFPEGLSFLARPFRVEWAESEARLGAIETERLDKIFENLGGDPFLRALRRAHAVYGEQLGRTVESRRVRGALDATMHALKDYVAQIAASSRGAERTSQAQASRMLAPIARAVRSKRDDDARSHS